MIARHPGIRFQCFLSSAHANQALCTLARELPNFSLAGYWWHNFFPSFIERVMSERLDMLVHGEAGRVLLGCLHDGVELRQGRHRARVTRSGPRRPGGGGAVRQESRRAHRARDPLRDRRRSFWAWSRPFRMSRSPTTAERAAPAGRTARGSPATRQGGNRRHGPREEGRRGSGDRRVDRRPGNRRGRRRRPHLPRRVPVPGLEGRRPAAGSATRAGSRARRSWPPAGWAPIARTRGPSAMTSFRGSSSTDSPPRG